MYQPLDDQTLPLSARMALADAALAYANALVQGNAVETEAARIKVARAAHDVRICLRAQQFGMV